MDDAAPRPAETQAAALRLARLRLTEFRSYGAGQLEFEARAIVLTGPNGAGKTNLLEAISLLGPGRGLRAAKVADLPRAGAPAWGLAGSFEDAHGPFEIGTGQEPGGNPDRRLLRLDGEVVRTQALLAERVAAVWITPQMDRLFQEGAGGRRRFLDRLVLALEPGHAREAAAYEHAMTSRNRLLGEGRADPAWLASLEDAMARHAVALSAGRRAMVARLNGEHVTGDFPRAALALECPVATLLDEMPALAAEDRLREGWAASRPRDAAAGGATTGPHRSDVLFIDAARGLPAHLASTGEQKAMLVSTVLAHAALIARARGFAPLLLLDEVAAHLDSGRREALFAALLELPAQVFLTGTEEEIFAPLGKASQGFRIGPGGTISRTSQAGL
ncbi:MAG: DNA replication/repair protein RecF [Acetobacteraceae bacterium]|nr:DNA replication/repair protein RecF [Acetobacteraceae bacterium]